MADLLKKRKNELLMELSEYKDNKTVRDCIPPPPPAVLSTNRSVTKIRDDLPGHVEMLIFHVETTAAYCQTQGEEYY